MTEIKLKLQDNSYSIELSYKDDQNSNLAYFLSNDLRTA